MRRAERLNLLLDEIKNQQKTGHIQKRLEAQLTHAKGLPLFLSFLSFQFGTVLLWDCPKVLYRTPFVRESNAALNVIFNHFSARWLEPSISWIKCCYSVQVHFSSFSAERSVGHVVLIQSFRFFLLRRLKRETFLTFVRAHLKGIDLSSWRWRRRRPRRRRWHVDNCTKAPFYLLRAYW